MRPIKKKEKQKLNNEANDELKAAPQYDEFFYYDKWDLDDYNYTYGYNFGHTGKYYGKITIYSDRVLYNLNDIIYLDNTDSDFDLKVPHFVGTFELYISDKQLQSIVKKNKNANEIYNYLLNMKLLEEIK